MVHQALLFCADEKAAHIVEKILSELDFDVAPCSEPFAAVKRITTEHFEVLVVDCNNERDATLLFKSARNSALNHSSLAVAVVEGQAGIAKAFRIGANLVLSKPINVEQSKSTLRVARGLLRKAEAAKPASAPSPQLSASPASADPVAFPTFTPAPETVSSPLTLSPSMAVPPTAPTIAAGLEVEADEEPAPALGAAEAALLESMPEPLAPQPNASLGISKSQAWQPASKPLPDPDLASSVLAKPESASPQTFKTPASQLGLESSAPQKSGRSMSGLSFESAAAATAPAKETPASSSQEVKPVSVLSETTAAPAPTKPRASKPSAGPATLRLDVHKEEAQNQKTTAPAPDAARKNLLIAVVLVLAVAAAGYFAWPRLRPAIMNLGIVQKYLGPKPAQAHVPAPVLVVPSAAQTSPAPAPASALSASQLGAGPQPTGGATATASATPPQPASSATSQAPANLPASGTAAASKQSQQTASPEPLVATSHPTAVPRAAAPLVVKSDLKRGAQDRQVAPPAAIDIASNSSDKAIAGIVNVPPVLAAKPVLQVVHVSQGVSNGLLIKRIPPTYPTLALQLRVEGTVELEATVDKDGSISNIKVIKGDAMLARAAVDAVKRWKYKPYYLDGQPVQLQTQITINFKLPI